LRIGDLIERGLVEGKEKGDKLLTFTLRPTGAGYAFIERLPDE
jgi:hypothetical protein